MIDKGQIEVIGNCVSEEQIETITKKVLAATEANYTIKRMVIWEFDVMLMASFNDDYVSPDTALSFDVRYHANGVPEVGQDGVWW